MKILENQNFFLLPLFSVPFSLLSSLFLPADPIKRAAAAAESRAASDKHIYYHIMAFRLEICA
jgi:hypothetical protein